MKATAGVIIVVKKTANTKGIIIELVCFKTMASKIKDIKPRQAFTVFRFPEANSFSFEYIPFNR